MTLPIPSHFKPRNVGKLWKVEYEHIARLAIEWQKSHRIQPAKDDQKKICLLAIDVQNTFCLPQFELFVGGRSGKGAVDDNRRLCKFIYRNLDVITQIIPTMDTHQAMQIFHSFFFVDENGNHPEPMTMISADDIQNGRWRFNEALAEQLGYTNDFMEKYLLYYTQRLQRNSKYLLTIWPYHAMLGGIGHALVPAFEEAVFFHTIARNSQPEFQLKGNHPLTEHYSALQPEVTHDVNGKLIVGKNEALLNKLLTFDAVIIAGQAKSHCVAWTVADLLKTVKSIAPDFVDKIYLLEDCASPVCVPGVVDFTDIANETYQQFKADGVHVVKSTRPIEKWLAI
jgi:nicotinamidase-related amidase